MNADGPCPVCGTGFRLPSGQCDHCDAASPWSKIPTLREYDKLADAILSYIPMTGMEMPADRIGSPRFALGMITGALALAQAQLAQLQADNAKLRCDGYASDSLIDMIVAHAGISTKYSDKYGRGEAISEVINHIDDLRARNVGTDFIIEKQRQVILACADPKGGFLSTGPEQVIAYQASLRTQLKDMTDQFFAVSQQDAKRLDALHRMRGDSSWEESEQFLKDVWNRNDGTDLRGSLDIELKRLEAESVSPPDAALQSSRAAEEKP